MGVIYSCFFVVNYISVLKKVNFCCDTKNPHPFVCIKQVQNIVSVQKVLLIIIFLISSSLVSEIQEIYLCFPKTDELFDYQMYMYTLASQLIFIIRTCCIISEFWFIVTPKVFNWSWQKFNFLFSTKFIIFLQLIIQFITYGIFICWSIHAFQAVSSKFVSNRYDGRIVEKFHIICSISKASIMTFY